VNILPLVFTFLIILSCISFTFLREIKSVFLVERSLEGFHRAERVVNNKIAQKAYRDIRGEAFNKKEPNSKTDKKKDYISKRSSSPPLDSSKFNLGPLVHCEGELRLHPFYEPLAEFLRLLYKNCLFAKVPHSEKIEYRLIEAMIKKARQFPDIDHPIEQLYPDDPALAKVFYKMLKGTNRYDRNQGIPPLENFILLNKEKTCVSLSFASSILLEALFSDEIATQILQEEKQKYEETNKYYYFSKEDLQATLMKNPSRASSFSSLESYLNYSKQSPPRTMIAGRDSKTGIGIQKPL
jgi:hypothetical protein